MIGFIVDGLICLMIAYNFNLRELELSLFFLMEQETPPDFIKSKKELQSLYPKT